MAAEGASGRYPDPRQRASSGLRGHDRRGGGSMKAHRRRTSLGGWQKRRLSGLVGVLTLAVVYWVPLRRWLSRWGTTAEELERVMPGDGLIANPTDMSTGAITVNAPPEDISPWLVQIGTGRGGLYSYDWLDRLFGFLDHPSTTRILPEFSAPRGGRQDPLGARRAHGLGSATASRARSEHGRSRNRVGVAIRPLSARRSKHPTG